MILQGRVRVNRKTIDELGARADPYSDKIEVDGELIRFKTPSTYVLLNKPKNYISALKDPQNRPLVTELLKKVKRRVFPVGRLDYDAEGVLLLTDDGELANRLVHPRYKVKKKYLVKVRDVPDEKDLRRLREGVYLSDGRTNPAIVKLVRETRENSWIEITVTEGRNRLIKRMCERVGHPVSKLKRIEFAGFKLHRLKPGEYRFLSAEEVARLKKTAFDKAKG